MTLVWMYTRLWILPFVVLWSMAMEGQYVMKENFPVLCYIAYRHFWYLFMFLLILLHTAWFVMFLRMYHTLFVKKECQDLSEHKKGESPVKTCPPVIEITTKKDS